MSGWNRGFLLGASALVFAVLAGVAMAWGGMRARAQSLSMVDQFGGASYAVALQGDALYAGAGPRVLALSAGDPASPALLARSQPLAGVVQRILPAGERLFVAAGPAGLYALRRDDLAVVAQLPLSGFVEDLSLVGDRLYLALSPMWEEETGQWAGHGVAVVDVSQPDALSQTGFLQTPGWPFGLDAADGRLFLADGERARMCGT